MESPIGTALNIIHEQFIGEKITSTEADKKEYHQMKCCSLKRHLLDAHYKRMSILFYKLNGFNEPSLKHVFIASLPTKLQPDLQRKITATNLSIADISLARFFKWPCYLLIRSVNKKNSSKISWKTRNPSLKLVKNLISKWSAKMKRSVFARLKRKNITRNTSTENHPPKKLYGISKRKMLLNSERKNPTVISFARNAVTLPELVLTNQPKLFDLFNIFNILLCYLRMRM